MLMRYTGVRRRIAFIVALSPLAFLPAAEASSSVRAGQASPITSAEVLKRLETARKAYSQDDFAAILLATQRIVESPVLSKTTSEGQPVASEIWFYHGWACLQSGNTHGARTYLRKSASTGENRWAKQSAELLGDLDTSDLDRAVSRLIDYLSKNAYDQARNALKVARRDYPSPPTGVKEDLECVDGILACYDAAGRESRGPLRDCLRQYSARHPDGRLALYASNKLAQLSRPKVCFVEQGHGRLGYSEYDGTHREWLTSLEHGRVQFAEIAADSNQYAFVARATDSGVLQVYVGRMGGSETPAEIWSKRVPEGAIARPVVRDLRWTPTPERQSLAFIAPTANDETAVWLWNSGDRRAESLEGSVTPPGSAEQSSFRWSPDGHYLAYLDGGRFLRVVRRDRTGVGGGKRITTTSQVLDFTWARSPDVGAEPVLIGLTRGGVFMASVLGGDIRVDALELTMSEPSAPAGGIVPTPQIRVATCAVTAADVVPADKERTLGAIGLSCRADTGMVAVGETTLYLNPEARREVESKLLKQIGKQTGKVKIDLNRAIVVDIQFDRYVYDASTQTGRLDGIRVRGIRTDISPDNVSRLSDLGPAVVQLPPEEWEKRSRIDVSSDGSYASLFDEKSQTAYIYGLAPFRELDRLKGVSDVKFAPQGPFLAFRSPDGLYLAPNPSTAS